MEHLDVMNVFNGDGEYCPGSVTSRNLRWAKTENKPDNYFPSFVRCQVLKWDISWWNISSFTVPCKSKGVFLYGLITVFIFILFG